MSNRRFATAIQALVVGYALGFRGAQAGDIPTPVAGGSLTNGSALSESRELRWREDLDYFAKELPVRHKSFYKLIPKAKFTREVAGLERDVPELSDPEIVLRLMRLVAGLGVAHTRLQWPSGALTFHRYPIRLEWFSDGLAVVSATARHREAIGARVVGIGSRTPEQVEALVADYLAHDNEAGLRQESPGFMIVAELLGQLKIAGADGRLKLTLSKGNREPFTIEIAPATADEERQMVSARQALQVPPPLRDRHPDAAYWHEYLPDSRSLYLQYRSCQNAPGKPFAKYLEELFVFADTNAVERLVVDLRDNCGGNSEVIKPLLKGLKSRPALSAKGRLYVLAGRDTLSSGMWAALDFRKQLQAILVGEPTGGKPNGYGDIRTLELPNSRLRVWYSTQHFRLIRFADPASINPDIPVSCSLDDFLAGRDPVLDAALSRKLE